VAIAEEEEGTGHEDRKQRGHVRAEAAVVHVPAVRA
jgi:hypothetical protein